MPVPTEEPSPTSAPETPPAQPGPPSPTSPADTPAGPPSNPSATNCQAVLQTKEEKSPEGPNSSSATSSSTEEEPELRQPQAAKQGSKSAQWQKDLQRDSVHQGMREVADAMTKANKKELLQTLTLAIQQASGNAVPEDLQTGNAAPENQNLFIGSGNTLGGSAKPAGKDERRAASVQAVLQRQRKHQDAKLALKRQTEAALQTVDENAQLVKELAQESPELAQKLQRMRDRIAADGSSEYSSADVAPPAARRSLSAESRSSETHIRFSVFLRAFLNKRLFSSWPPKTAHARWIPA